MIDQEVTYPKAATPISSISSIKENFNGFDFNNYLKRKISATIEEGISGVAKKPRRPRARKKNNGDATYSNNHMKAPYDILQYSTEQETQPPLRPNNMLAYLLENRTNKLLDSNQLENVANNKGTGVADMANPKDEMGDMFDVGGFKNPSRDSVSLSPVTGYPLGSSSNNMNLGTNNSGVCNTSLISSVSMDDNLAIPTQDSASSGTSMASKRKIFQCSSCNKYYENWNLFIHMRQIHKKHICLYCLRLFNNAEKLLGHLENKHNLTKKYYNDKNDILNSYKNMYNSKLYLMCMQCEHVFNETDESTNHLCEEFMEPCSVCGLKQKCDHSKKSDVNSSLPSSNNSSNNSSSTNSNNSKRRRSNPKKNNLRDETPATPEHNCNFGTPVTPSSGGELKMKFKFNRLSDGTGSPCKITVESPLTKTSDREHNFNGSFSSSDKGKLL